MLKNMFRIKMIWSSVGLFLALALVNTQGLSIHGDEVEQELDVSRVVKILRLQQKQES